MLTELTLPTTGPGCYEITGQVAGWLTRTRPKADGVLTIFVRHSSASLLIQENADSDVQVDLLGYLDRLVPQASDPSMGWLRHVTEGPDDMPAHIKAALLPVSLSVPVQGGRMTLGRWQGIYLVEHRLAPHTRQVVLAFS
ncbi:MAG: secondary thiamine-phosphate synthase enzyme YjbQ [Qingshengfaniella sp.]